MLNLWYISLVIFLSFNNAKYCCVAEAEEKTTVAAAAVYDDDENLSEARNDNNNENKNIISYKGSQLWRIEYDEETLDELRKNNDIQIWYANKERFDALITENNIENIGKILKNANLNYSISINDVQQALDVQNPSKEYVEELMNRNGLPITWSAYHRLADIYKYLEFIAKSHSDLVDLETIGQSAENRPLKLVRISNKDKNNRAIWIDGNIHAREWITSASVTFLIHKLLEDWNELPDYMRKIDWYFVPVVNPDGYEYTHTRDRLWRKSRRGSNRNCRGIDLNRNFGFKWGGKGSSTRQCSEIYGGSSAFSEPETMAIKKVFESTNAVFHGAVTFHSYGQYILFPYGYDYHISDDYQDLLDLGEKAAQKMALVSGNNFKVGHTAHLLYPASGGFHDWAKGVLNVKYSYAIELRDQGQYGFSLPASHIKGSGNEAYAFVETLAQAVVEKK